MPKKFGFKEQFALVSFIASCCLAMVGLTMFVTHDPKTAMCYALVGLVGGFISGIFVDNLFSDEESGRLPEKKDCGDSKAG